MSDGFDDCDPSELGPNWTTAYSASGTMSQHSAGNAEWVDWKSPPLLMQSLSFKLSDSFTPAHRPIIYTQYGPRQLPVGCSICGQPWKTGDEAISHNDGPFHHVGCQVRPGD